MNRELRRKVYERFKRRCAKCRKPVRFSRMEVDHVKQVSEGGTDKITNLRPLCISCHRFRHHWTGEKRRTTKTIAGWDRTRVWMFRTRKTIRHVFTKKLRCGCEIIFTIPWNYWSAYVLHCKKECESWQNQRPPISKKLWAKITAEIAIFKRYGKAYERLNRQRR